MDNFNLVRAHGADEKESATMKSEWPAAINLHKQGSFRNVQLKFQPVSNEFLKTKILILITTTTTAAAAIVAIVVIAVVVIAVVLIIVLIIVVRDSIWIVVVSGNDGRMAW